METKKKEQNTKAEAETFAATVKGMNRDDQLMQYLFTCASFATGLPLEFFQRLPAKDAVSVKNAVSGSFFSE